MVDLMINSTTGKPLVMVAKPKCCQLTFQGSFVSVKPTSATNARNHCKPMRVMCLLERSQHACCDLVMFSSLSKS